MTLLRSALFNLLFYATLALWTIAGCLAAVLWPARLKSIEASWAGLNLRLLRRLCGVRVVVRGLDRLPEGAAIIASMHQSALDTFLWVVLVPRGIYVVKRELSRIPVYGWLMIRLGHIPVDRAQGAAALRGLLRDGGAALARGDQVVIFPEGTRVAAGQSGKLQPGVAALARLSRAPVIPVATDSGLRWGRNAFLKRPGTVHVVIGPPLPAGLARAALLTALQQSWETLAASFPPCG